MRPGGNATSKRATKRLNAKNMPSYEVTIHRATNDEIGAINVLMQESSAYQQAFRYRHSQSPINFMYVCTLPLDGLCIQYMQVSEDLSIARGYSSRR
jgi:hypothetical protein